MKYMYINMYIKTRRLKADFFKKEIIQKEKIFAI